MGGVFLHLLGGEHFGFLMKQVFIAPVIDAGITGTYDEDGTVFGEEGQGFGNAAWLGVQGVGGQLHSGAGLLKKQDGIIFSKLGQMSPG